MRTIIGLRGVGNSGKSTTIRSLHDLLMNNGYTQVMSDFFPAGRDFIAIFSKSDKYIGITSCGDSFDLVHDRLQELVNANCIVCVCACRTFGRTNTAIEGFTHYVNQYVPKTIDNNPTTQGTTNMNDALSLLRLIEHLS